MQNMVERFVGGILDFSIMARQLYEQNVRGKASLDTRIDIGVIYGWELGAGSLRTPDATETIKHFVQMTLFTALNAEIVWKSTEPVFRL